MLGIARVAPRDLQTNSSFYANSAEPQPRRQRSEPALARPKSHRAPEPDEGGDREGTPVGNGEDQTSAERTRFSGRKKKGPEPR